MAKPVNLANDLDSNYGENSFLGKDLYRTMGTMGAARKDFSDKFAFVPDDPTFNSPYDENGRPKAGFEDIGYRTNGADLDAKLAGITLDKTALNKYRDFATSDATSPWAQMQLDLNRSNTNTNFDNAAKSSNAGAAKAYSALGARGGLRSGAMERIARGSANDLINSKQDIRKADATNQLGIMSQDETNKLQALQALPGMEVQALQPELQKTSLWSQMANADSAGTYGAAKDNRNFRGSAMDAQNQFNQYLYGEQMKGAAAERTAQGTENAGKK